MTVHPLDWLLIDHPDTPPDLNAQTVQTLPYSLIRLVGANGSTEQRIYRSPDGRTYAVVEVTVEGEYVLNAEATLTEAAARRVATEWALDD